MGAEMKIRGVILVNDPQNSKTNELLYRQVQGKPFFVWQVEKVLGTGRNPIITLGADGDDWLRDFRILDKCDLVYGQDADKNSFENMQPGFAAAGTCTFVLPFWTPFPEDSVWQDLETRYAQLTAPYEISGYRPRFEDQMGYPFVLTPLGLDKVRKLPEPPQSMEEFVDTLEETFVVQSPSACQNVLEDTQFESWKSRLNLD
jgi:hypothetical protein